MIYKLIFSFVFFAATSTAFASDESHPEIKYNFYINGCQHCYSYRIDIYESGHVEYFGALAAYPKPPASSHVTEVGVRHSKVPPEKVKEWIRILAEEDFLNLENFYVNPHGCTAERVDQSISLRINGDYKTVSWFWCSRQGFSEAVRRVAREIRSEVNPEQWLKIENSKK